MKKMKKLILLVSVILLFYSCNFNNKYDIPKDEIPLLNNNDILYYRDSASCKIDTFSLKIDDYWKDSYDGNKYRAISVFYHKINKKNPLLVYGIIAESRNIASFSVVYYINSPIGYDNVTNILSYTIQKVTYPSVYLSQNVTPDTIPNKVYFTCQNGVIRYEYKDGRVYNLVSK